MKKTALTLLLVIALLCCGLAHGEAPAAVCGDYEYRLLENGTAEITKYSGSAAELSVPAELDGHPVSAIGDYGFMFCLGLKRITIPAGVERIGVGAFSMCYYLSEINLPDGLLRIDENVFWDCASLYRFAVPASVEYIHENAFTSCPGLTLVVEAGSYAEAYARENGIAWETAK